MPVTLDSHFANSLRNLYNAESQLGRELISMEKAAHDPALKSELQAHEKACKMNQERLNKVFGILGEERETTDGAHSEAMAGVLREYRNLSNENYPASIKDLEIVNILNKVESLLKGDYELLKRRAKELDYRSVADLLNQASVAEQKLNDKLAAVDDTLHANAMDVA